MRLFTSLALTVGAAALGYGMIAAPAAQAAAPHQAPTITFNCAVERPVPPVYPQMAEGAECTPYRPGDFRDVVIALPSGSWFCSRVRSEPANYGLVDVTGWDCQLLGR